MTEIMLEGKKFLYLKNILCISNYIIQRAGISMGVMDKPGFTFSQITTCTSKISQDFGTFYS
jgi:hypothetical protein